MVFSCRCFSFLFEEVEGIGYESGTQTKSTSSETYYSASSLFLDLAGKREKSGNLRVFTFAELKAATYNFSSDWKIGEGGFGSVYTGMVKSLEHPFDKIEVAVKYAEGVRVTKAHKNRLYEFKCMRMIKHPNLVKLVGYCEEDNLTGRHMLLVYEYMPNRSVGDHLFTTSETPLSWIMRLKVAQDAARGLTYLHEEVKSPILYKDFSSFDILLDDQCNAKLFDFGVSRLDPQERDTHNPKKFARTMAYAAPEYIQTGELSPKIDVWSYGVFLYELITGRYSLDRSRPQNVQNLLDWVRPYVDSQNLQHIIDPRLEGMCSFKSVEALAIVADLCLKWDPVSRPKMSEVLEMVNNLIGSLSQVISPVPAVKSPDPVLPRSQLLKSRIKKVCCCVWIANSK